jgi:hypothetical protein
MLGVELLFLFFSLSGQQSFTDLTAAAFGLNQDLVNGIQHTNRYQRTLGNPYFLQEGTAAGSVVIDERRYPDVNLKYDLYAQTVIIAYKGAGGRIFSLLAVSERLREFRIGGFEFERLSLPSQPQQYYQVVRTDFFTTYIHWEKILLANNKGVYYSDHFSNPRLSYFLEMEGSINSFHNRKSFAELFPEDLSREVRRWLRKEQVKFRNANPAEIVEVMSSIEKLVLRQEDS